MQRVLPEEEARLARALASGDRDLFAAYTASVQRPLFAYAMRLLRNRHDAEDVAREALVRLFEQALSGKLRPDPRAIRALLFAIAHNLAVDENRRNNRLHHESVPESLSMSGSGTNLLREELERAMSTLPAQHREALLLREYGGLSYAEIAEAMGISEGVVKVSIYRARHKLATLLDRDGQYTGGATGTGDPPR
jgi:RNA polymerase sigma factor (sigma-70 family)